MTLKNPFMLKNPPMLLNQINLANENGPKFLHIDVKDSLPVIGCISSCQGWHGQVFGNIYFFYFSPFINDAKN